MSGAAADAAHCLYGGVVAVLYDVLFSRQALYGGIVPRTVVCGDRRVPVPESGLSSKGSDADRNADYLALRQPCALVSLQMPVEFALLLCVLFYRWYDSRGIYPPERGQLDRYYAASAGMCRVWLRNTV